MTEPTEFQCFACKKKFSVGMTKCAQCFAPHCEDCYEHVQKQDEQCGRCEKLLCGNCPTECSDCTKEGCMSCLKTKCEVCLDDPESETSLLCADCYSSCFICSRNSCSGHTSDHVVPSWKDGETNEEQTICYKCIEEGLENLMESQKARAKKARTNKE